ncbi:kinesin-like protein Klp68D [Colias croceus]|uniref:kinesin-like protein Klp68D n=1 Tax=Colias crocea TaxID=72248 RepID=UPI001E2800F4|nr:kinesin-like protein Klp68D [Colias croceus]
MEKSARPRTALNECVKVVVRCRPLSEKEKNDNYEEVKKSSVEKKWYERLSTKQTAETKFEGPLQVVKVWPERGAVQVNNPKGQDKLFTYDAAYDCTADTKTIYDEMVRPLVASVLDGFNGCVFAYGQTGTGKTHTMEGTPDDEGIIPRTFRHMWAHIENTASPDVTHLVSCSFVELYLEDVRDLLSKECKKLTIRGQELNGFYIPEMTSIVCKSAAEMVRVMRAGNRNRAAGRTDMNEHSSRSHAVFLVTVETAHRSTNRIRVGKLNLVDLAGSERQRKTGASADRLREAARINQALSSLGNVISALAENSPHVPYRDSKLTRILQDSLGGNSKTIMIANIGPACYNYDETVTTLRYAHRAKAIKNKPVRNEDPKDAKLREYQAEIERLRALIEQRKAAEKRKKPPKPRVKNMPESEEDTAIIETEHILAASTIEQEKTRTEELEHQIRSLEERLVQGGGGKDLLNNLNESQVILEQRHMEIAERKKREIEMQQKIDLEEETTAIVTNTFTTLQQEVDHKTQRLARCLQKYAALREEAVEQREAHDAERREHEALQAALLAALRRRLLLADSFVPAAGRHAVLRLRYDDDADAWDLPPHSGAEPLTVRPVALAGSRRPVCGGLAARRRPDNLLELRPLPLPSTVRHYPPPSHPTHPPTAHTPHTPTAHTPHARSLSAAKVIKSVEAPMKKDIPESRRVSAKPRPPSALHRLGTAGVR